MVEALCFVIERRGKDKMEEYLASKVHTLENQHIT